MQSRLRKVTVYQNYYQPHLEATLCRDHERKPLSWFGRLGGIARGTHKGYCQECDRLDSIENKTLVRDWRCGERV